MPICEADPWRLQYFMHAYCPPDVNIPTEDCDAWLWYPAQRWVYDKIAVAQSQGIEAAPHGVMPSRFPVFSKPITNLRGMGVASRVLHDAREYAQNLTPGHMWMRLLQGPHVSSDVVIVDGAEPTIEDYCGAWIAQHLRGYTGILNIETIGARMIEVHLRMSDQWPDLYGAGWLDAVVRLYAQREWAFADRERRNGYSVVLFAPHGPKYRHPPAALLARVGSMPGVSSVQITFHEEKDPQGHAMPPGGFRLAIVNAWSLAAGFAARDMLSACLLARAA
jgi:hypothetical protein